MKTGNEIKDFNIVEALKYAPKGLKLYTPLFGEVEFDEIEYGMIRIKGSNVSECFYEDGRYYSNFPGSECLLFPSVNHRCWQHWQNTLFLESTGSVCVDTITGYKYILENNGTFFSDGTGSGYSVVIENDESNYFLNSRYASPEETKEFFAELDKKGYKWDGKKVVKKEDKQKFYVGDNVYKWDGKDLKKEQNKPKFKIGDIIKHKPTGEISTIKKVCSNFYILDNNNTLYFEAQDMWEVVASKVKPTLEEKVNILADEIIALKERVKALEIQEIKQCSDKNRLDSLESKMIILDSHNINDRLDALERRVFPIPEICKCSDKAGDNVTLEEMKG